MKFDVSRNSYQATKNYSAVVQQQGRVTTDADWNEQQQIQARLRGNASRDIIGLSGVPRANAGYRISAVSNPAGDPDLHISAGRIYVDGTLIKLAEAHFFTEQSLFPGQSLPDSDGDYLAYLEVWQRGVTALEDPRLREIALGGIDTAGRLQSVAQVKLLPLAAGDYTAASLPPEWTALTDNSLPGRLRVRTTADEATAATGESLCSVGARGGYTGTDNRLYRIEIHEGGAPGTATFKWSRENATLVTEWLALDGNTLQIRALGRDAQLSFQPGDWIEIDDEGLELEGRPGTLARVQDIVGTALTIDPDTLRHYDGAPGPNAAGGRALNLDEYSRGARRVRRWSSSPNNGSTASGILTIPDASATDPWIEIESGIEVQFDTDASRTYRARDAWSFPARALSRNIEWPCNPDGTRQALPAHTDASAHSFARLAFVRRSAGAWQLMADTRRIFPSLTDAQLAYVSGDGQSILPGEQLTQSLALRVQTAGGEPIPAANVRFRVLGGGGTLSTLSDPTALSEVTVSSGADGLALVRWTTGDADAAPTFLSDQTVEAQLLSASGAPLPAIQRFHAHKSAAAATEYTPPVLTAPNGDDLMLGVATAKDGLDRLAEIKVNRAGDTITGSLQIDEDLTVEGTLTVRGDVIARDTDHIPGDVLLGDQDEDTITLHGALRSEHSSNTLPLDSGLRIRTVDETTAPLEIQAPVAGLAGRPYRAPLVIDNSANTNELTDYQLLVTLDTAALVAAGKLRADAGDLLFTDSDGTTAIAHWLESGANTANTRIWLRVPTIPASDSTTVYVYYGNPDATSQSSVGLTFVRSVGDVAGAWKLEAGSGTTVPDFSGANNAGTVNGTAVWSADNPFNSAASGSLEFNGTDNHIQLPGGNIIGAGNEPFTTAAWLYQTKDMTAPGAYYFAFRFQQDTQFYFSVNPTNGGLFTGFRGAAQRAIPFDVSTLANSWHHVAIVYNGGDKNVPTSYTIYIDGTALPVATVDAGVTGGSSNDNVIGSDDAGGTNTIGQFAGRMSQIRAYRRALSAAEIADMASLYGYVTLAAPGTEYLRNIAANEPAVSSGTEQLVPGSEQTIVYVQPGSGNVGVGTTTPGEKLSVDGIIESKSGGVKFPDGTIQTTAGGGGGMAGAFDTLPLGTILAWHRDVSGNPALPDGWVECNGQPVDDPLSPFHRLPNIVPDLNNARQSWNSKGSFLRGGTISGEFEDHHFQGHKHDDTGHTHGTRGITVQFWSPNGGTLDVGAGAGSYSVFSGSANLTDATTSSYGTPRFGDETRPVNMSVIWIMKVRQNGVGEGQSVYVKANYQLLDILPGVPVMNHTLTETQPFSGIWQDFGGTPINVELPTTGRFYVRGAISYFNRTGGAINLRMLIDDAVIGTVTTYIPALQTQDSAGTESFTTQIVAGLGGEQDVLAAGSHSVKFQIEMQDTGSLVFNRTQHGHGIHNLEIFGYDLSSQSAGLWDAQGENISRDAGNVGIGTDNPQAKLHIAGEIGVDGILFPDGTLQTTAGQGGTGGNLPLGTVLAWHKSFENTPQLPDGWVECNGQTLNDPASPYNGQTIPDLNNPKNAWNSKGSFLRGGATSGEFEDDAFQGHFHTVSTEDGRAGNLANNIYQPGTNNTAYDGFSGPTYGSLAARGAINDGTNGEPRTGSETRPANMSVVWIIKIRNSAEGPPVGGYVSLRDRKPTGTPGGQPPPGVYTRRDLNQLDTNIAGVSLANNQFTLPAGTYQIHAHMSVHRGERTRAKLVNVTDSVDVLYGNNVYTQIANIGSGTVPLSGVFTIAAEKTFEIQHFVSLTLNEPENFGIVLLNGEEEVYTTVDILQFAQPTPEGIDLVGSVQSFATEDAPEGWLPCDGREVSRTLYARLFQRIGDRFGSGDGSTTFTLPDMRGEFVRGWDGGRGVDAGRNLGTAQDDQIQGHNHLWGGENDTEASTLWVARQTIPGESNVSGVQMNNNGTVPAQNTSIGQPAGNSDYGTLRVGSETRSRNIALLYCIKY